MNLNQNQIVVLDDDYGVRQSLEIILSAEGYKVQSFACGADLIQSLQQNNSNVPAVAMLDLHLPDITGVQMMHKIKEKSAETEVIILTGTPDIASAIESVNAGAYAYILKPYNMDEIKILLGRIFEKQRLVRENFELTKRLKEWNKKLEEEVSHRTATLQDAYDKLESLHKLRREFIRIMSHELRIPITILTGFAERLQEKWEHLPKGKIQEYLNILNQESERVVNLMSEIFEISSIEERKLQFNLEEIDVEKFVAETIKEFTLRYPACNFKFEKKGAGFKAKVDPYFFKCAIAHILMNAIKYTAPGGQILISTETEKERSLLQIEDGGPGIPPELREKVFEPFFRSLDDVNRRTPGAGLGLTIARGIIYRLNGTIFIGEKTDGTRGCAVSISFPFKADHG